MNCEAKTWEIVATNTNHIKCQKHNTSHLLSFFFTSYPKNTNADTNLKMRIFSRPPCLTTPSSSFTRPNLTYYSCYNLFNYKPINKRFHFLNPTHSSLKQTKKQPLQTSSSSSSQGGTSLKRLLNLNNNNNENNNNKNKNDDDDDEGNEEGAIKGTIIAGLLLIGVVGGFGSVGYIYRDQINAFLIQFSSFIEGTYSFFFIGS